jgi:hypothetical protein
LISVKDFNALLLRQISLKSMSKETRFNQIFVCEA